MVGAGQLGGWVLLVLCTYGIVAILTFERQGELYLGIALVLGGIAGAIGSFYAMKGLTRVGIWIVRGFTDADDSPNPSEM